jgi:hypothetical protein
MNLRLITLVGGWLAVFAAGISPAAAADDTFTGTWSGSFDIHFADGRVADDTAWLVLRQTGKSVAGSAGPHQDQQTPIVDGVAAGKRLTFSIDSNQGTALKVALNRDGDRLSGEATGKMGDSAVRVVMDLKAVSTAAVPAPDPLYQKILALDNAMFDAFNECANPAELDKHAGYFVKELEFYHDNGGASWTRDEYMKGVRENVCGKFHRELDSASFRVWPVKNFGAISQGTHRFCHTATTCEGVAQFTMLWREKDGQWQVTRALSYDHREERVPAAGH